MTPVNRALMIACGVVWALQLVFVLGFRSRWPEVVFGLVPANVAVGWIWQPVTYLFLHSPSDPMHLLLNMLILWMFGGELERHWGGRRYLTYYLICGVGAGALVVLQALARGGVASQVALVPTIGASGAIYGLILAYGVLFAERVVMFMMIFPMKARTMTWILFGIAFLSNLSQSGDGLSHIAHLGGMAVGWVYLKRAWRIGDFFRDVRWRIRRRRFKVTPPSDDRWVN